MRGLLKIIGSLILLIVIILVSLPFFISADSIKDKLLANASFNGGKIAVGHVSFSFFPTVGLDADNVSVANPAWAGGGNMAQIKSVHVGVELLPLLHKEIELKGLTLDTPVFNAIKQGDKANWQEENAAKPAAGKPSTSDSHSFATINSIGEITVKNGTVNYTESGKPAVTVSDINLDIKAKDPTKEASFDGSFTTEGKKTALAFTVSNPMTINSGKPSDIDLKFSSGALELTWKGSVALSGNKPTITGTITIPEIDTAKMAEDKSKAPSPTAVPTPAPASTGHWSNAPINMQGLNQANLDVNIVINTLKLPKTTLSNIQAAVKLVNGTLTLSTNDIALYSGKANLRLAATSGNAINLDTVITGVKIEPLMHDFAGFSNLSGTLDSHIAASMAGASESAMVSALSGNGNFTVKDGELKGVNLASLVGNIAHLPQGASETTAFSVMSGSYTIKNGVLTNNDLKMESTAIRATGSGTIDLPNWQLNYLLEPMLVASGNNGITVPVRVSGPLDHPSYVPDLKAAVNNALKDPKQLKQNLKDIKKNLLNSDNLKGLLR